MKNLSHTISSLIIAALVSFLIPVGAIGVILSGFFLLLHCVPQQWGIDHLYLEMISILRIFGGGNFLKGIITIALTTTFAGILVTAFNIFYSHYSQPLSSSQPGS